MEFKGRYLIPASPQKVWNALNDPDILRACISGCERMEKTDDTHFHATAGFKIGPVKATFDATIVLDNLDPPRRCTIKGAGQGVVGSARCEAEVVLMPQDDGTELAYTAQAAIGGKLAQIGQRLIDGAAKQIADGFFARFATAIANIPDPIEDTPVPSVSMPMPPIETAPEPHGGLAPRIWVVGLIALVAALLLIFGLFTTL